MSDLTLELVAEALKQQARVLDEVLDRLEALEGGEAQGPQTLDD